MYNIFFLLKTCVFILSLLLSKSPEKIMTWSGWKRTVVGGEMVGECVSYTTQQGGGDQWFYMEPNMARGSQQKFTFQRMYEIYDPEINRQTK